MTTRDTVTQAWRALAPREKLMVAAAIALVGIALFWWIAVAPALAVLRTADAQHRTLDAQIGQMRTLQQQAQAMQAQPKQGHDDSVRALESSVRERLGATGRASVAGDRATVTLSGASPTALTMWLAEARINARALPAEAKLTRGATGGWDGTVVLTLPAR